MQKMEKEESEASVLKAWTDLENPGSFSGLKGFLKNSGLKVKKKDAAYSLSSLPTFTLHRAARKRWPRRKVFVLKSREQFQIDLLDMQKLGRMNGGVRFLLSGIDVFSKYGYLVPIKNKRPQTIVDALELMFKTAGFYVKNIESDRGKEFVGRITQDYFKKHNINHFHTESAQHVAIVERWHRTLREKLTRWMHFSKSKKYLKALEKFVYNYNRSIHRSHGMQH